MPLTKQDIEAARRELDYKSHEQIETETSLKWAARAIAAYDIFLETSDLTYLFDASDYHREAIEHAADTDVFDEVHSLLTDAKMRVMRGAGG